MPTSALAAPTERATVAALVWVVRACLTGVPELPRFAWPLAVYAGVTLGASFFSIDPRVSFWDSRQLLLFLIVPIAYRLLRGIERTKRIFG